MGDKKIFIVDDEKMLRDALEMAFSNAGYVVILAESGEEALEILKNDKPQVMFLDLNLPGINGVELCREIRKNLPLAVIHAVTGYCSLFELADCREAGFDDYFEKPVNISTLYKAAEDAFEKINRWKKK